jgi:hypothetical protein
LEGIFLCNKIKISLCINNIVDLLAPEIVCPDNQVVNLDPNGTHTLADYIANAVQQLQITVPILLLSLVKIHESESISKKIELELDVVLSEQEFEKMSGKASR